MLDSPTVAAVVVHVANVEHGLAWYENAFPSAVRSVSTATGFEFLKVGAVCLEFVPADEKVSSGAAGSVVYWRVESLVESLARLCSLGAILFRGPMQLEPGQAMCQVKDPWGNCIGLRGPYEGRE